MTLMLIDFENKILHYLISGFFNNPEGIKLFVNIFYAFNVIKRNSKAESDFIKILSAFV